MRPTLAQAAALAAEAEDLPVESGLRGALEELVRAGEDWEERAAAALKPRWVRAKNPEPPNLTLLVNGCLRGVLEELVQGL